jgi:FkbH-like protein
MSHMDRELAALKEKGNALLLEQRFDAAAGAYEEAAHLSELPRGGLCVKLARAHLAAGRPAAAAAWLMLVVDPAASFRTWSAAAALLARCPVETWPGIQRHLRVGLVGTWTTSAFAPLLRLAAARLGLALEIHEPDFGQYFNATLDPGSDLLARDLDALVLAPEHRALGVRAFTDTPEADADAEVARWSGVWSAVRRRAAPTILQMGFAVPGSDPLGHHALGLDGSRRSVITRINRDLAHKAAAEDVGFVNLALLASRMGTREWFDDRGWYMAKMPFAADSLPVIARHTAAVLAARLGLSRRAVVVDLDNTLWGGVVGDDGLSGIVLGGGTAGEAYQDFQVALKELTGRGILLAVCSKNDPEVALAPFREHPEMVLKEDDIAAFVANWEPKSENIRTISSTLGLGLASLTFLDDNPYERAEVRRALPEVDVPVLPDDPTSFRRTLEEYPYFEPAAFTPADRDRAGQYRARARAAELAASAGSLAEYQASLTMTARTGGIDPGSIARVVQLLNKTNQFNLTTRRRNRAELEAFLARPGAQGLTLRLADRFADHGLVAVALAEAREGGAREGGAGGRVLEIDTLLMSCRVLGRGVEALVLAELARLAAAAGCAALTGSYLPSGRNGMVAELYPRHGFAKIGEEEGATRWSVDPAALTVTGTHIHLVRE